MRTLHTIMAILWFGAVVFYIGACIITGHEIFVTWAMLSLIIAILHVKEVIIFCLMQINIFLLDI